MTHINVLDPGASPLDYHGFELRRHRGRPPGSPSGDSATSSITPTAPWWARSRRPGSCRRRSSASGWTRRWGREKLLSRLVDLVMRIQHRTSVSTSGRVAGTGHGDATRSTRTRGRLGLLQTEAYARAVLEVLDQSNLDDRTSVRIARQKIFEKDEPPVFWAVLSRCALRREMGGRETMQEQLAYW